MLYLDLHRVPLFKLCLNMTKIKIFECIIFGVIIELSFKKLFEIKQFIKR